MTYVRIKVTLPSKFAGQVGVVSEMLGDTSTHKLIRFSELTRPVWFSNHEIEEISEREYWTAMAASALGVPQGAADDSPTIEEKNL